MKPLAKGFEEVAVEVRDSIEEAAPDGPGGFIRTFLVDFREIGFAVAPKVNALTDARGETIASGVGHVRSSEDLVI